MSTQKYILPDQESISLSGSAAQKLIRRGDGSAALLYIYMLKNKGNLEISQAQTTMGYTEQQIHDAMGALRAMGLITGGTSRPEKERAPVEELPEYSKSEIADQIETNKDFSMLVKEVESSLGKVLNTKDLQILMGIYGYLEMPSDVILLLVSCCIDEYQEKYGEGKFPSLRGIEKVAYIWVRNGIMSLEEGMKYIKRREDQKRGAGAIAKVMHIKGELTETQKKYIYAWMDWGFKAEAIGKAYDLTVVNTGELKWPYMNKILSSWHEKGFHTLDEIDEGMNKRKKTVEAKTKGQTIIIPDKSEIERKKRFIEELKRQKN